MRIEKETLVGFLRIRGDHFRADRADNALPDVVDTDRDRLLLERFAIDVDDLALVVRHSDGRSARRRSA